MRDVLCLCGLAVDLLLQLEAVVRVALRLLRRLVPAVLRHELALGFGHLPLEVEHRHVIRHGLSLVRHLLLDAVLPFTLLSTSLVVRELPVLLSLVQMPSLLLLLNRAFALVQLALALVAALLLVQDVANATVHAIVRLRARLVDARLEIILRRLVQHRVVLVAHALQLGAARILGFHGAALRVNLRLLPVQDALRLRVVRLLLPQLLRDGLPHLALGDPVEPPLLRGERVDAQALLLGDPLALRLFKLQPPNLRARLGVVVAVNLRDAVPLHLELRLDVRLGLARFVLAVLLPLVLHRQDFLVRAFPVPRLLVEALVAVRRDLHGHGVVRGDDGGLDVRHLPFRGSELVQSLALGERVPHLL